jgi:hypothetical protein
MPINIGSGAISGAYVGSTAVTAAYLGSTQVLTTGATDPDFANVVLLLHMDGSDGSTTFTDSSSYARTATVNGNAQIDTAESKYGGAAGLFSGVQSGSGSAEVADGVIFADSNDFTMGSSDWTIEAWIRQTNNAENMEIAAQRDADNFGSFAFWLFRINTDGTARFYFTNSGTLITDITTTETVTLDTWHHVAAVRSSGSVSVYIDGVASGSGTNLSTAYEDPPGNLSVGVGGDLASNTGWGGPYVGSIDDFRWTIGTARYTSNFTPPTAAFPDL